MIFGFKSLFDWLTENLGLSAGSTNPSNKGNKIKHRKEPFQKYLNIYDGLRYSLIPGTL